MGTHETFIFLGYFTHIFGVEKKHYFSIGFWVQGFRVFQFSITFTLLGKVESETQPWASGSTMKKS